MTDWGKVDLLRSFFQADHYYFSFDRLAPIAPIAHKHGSLIDVNLHVVKDLEEEPGAPTGDPGRRGLLLLCAKPLYLTGKNDMFVICFCS